MAQPSTPVLEGVRALVTGGTSGLGFAMSQALAEAGARVVLTGRTEPRVHDAATRICPPRHPRSATHYGGTPHPARRPARHQETPG